MKFVLLTLLLTGTAMSAQAQQAAKPVGIIGRTEEYCQVESWTKLNGKTAVAIDYGQQQELLSRNVYRDAEGKPLEFNSVIDALNWLNSQGWELVNAYSKDKISQYVMRRRIGL